MTLFSFGPSFGLSFCPTFYHRALRGMIPETLAPRTLSTRTLSTRALALAALTLGLVLPGLASACDYYRDTETRREIYDLPDAGQGLAIAILPPGASACIVETAQDGSGKTWERLEFYTLEDVKYSNAVGWLLASGEPPRPASANAAQETTAPAPAPARAEAADDPGAKAAFFGASWSLLPQQSHLGVMSIKKGDIAEIHSFADLSGQIAPDGSAVVAVGLESVETGVDIRNVRMRFLFFEIDSHPKAEIRTTLNPGALAPLWESRRMTLDLPFRLRLHGQEHDMDVPVVVSRLGPKTVSVASAAPVLIDLADFGLTEGLGRLSAAVGDIDITPVVPVHFSLAFAAD